MKLLLALLIFLSFACHAEDESNTTDQYRLAGESAFRAGEYREAIEYFEFALTYEPNNQATLFNLAVAYWKINKLDEAQKLLKELIYLGNNTAKTYYTLAVIEKNRGNEVDAFYYFKLVEASGDANLAGSAGVQAALLEQDSPYLSDIDATTALVGVEGQSVTGEPRALVTDNTVYENKTWSGFFNIGYGHDDSIIGLTTDIATAGDNYADLLMLVTKRGKDFDRHWYSSGFVYATRYAEVSEFDVTVYSLTVGRATKVWGGSADFSGAYERNILDGEGYMETLNFNARYSKRLKGHNRWGITYRGKMASALQNDYAYLENKSAKLELFYSTSSRRRNTLQFTYSYLIQEHDDRIYPEDDYRYYNLSVQRHQLKIDWRIQLSEKLRFRTHGNLRHSRYFNDFVLDDTGAQKREEDLKNYGVEASFDATANLSLSLRWLKAESTSTIEVYDYSRGDTSIALDWSF